MGKYVKKQNSKDKKLKKYQEKKREWKSEKGAAAQEKRKSE